MRLPCLALYSPLLCKEDEETQRLCQQYVTSFYLLLDNKIGRFLIKMYVFWFYLQFRYGKLKTCQGMF